MFCKKKKYFYRNYDIIYIGKFPISWKNTEIIFNSKRRSLFSRKTIMFHIPLNCTLIQHLKSQWEENGAD